MTTTLSTGVRYALEIDGSMCGFVSSVVGGGGVREVREDSHYQPAKKSLAGSVRWEEVALQLQVPPAAPVRDWISASWSGKAAPRTVAITTVDGELQAIRKREFRNAFLTGTSLSEVNAAARDVGLLTLKLSPEAVATTTASGTIMPPKPGAVWVRSSFRLELGELACGKVQKIDSFTVTQTVLEALTGDSPTPTRVPGQLSFPTLTVTLPEAAAGTWQAWFDSFVVQGKSAETEEKTGRLVLLSPDRTKGLASIGLFNVGIFRLATSLGTGPAADSIVAGLFCDRMDFTVPS